MTGAGERGRAAGGTPQPDWADRYDARDFPPFSYTSDGVVFSGREPSDLRVATVERDAPDPFAGLRAWPGGFVDWADDADARAAVVRHLGELAGLPEPPLLEPLDTYDAFGRDPRQFAEHGARGVSKAFWGLVRPDSPHDLRPGGRHASAPAWRSVYDFLPWEDRREVGATGAHPLLAPVLERAAEDAGIGEDRVRNAFGDPWNEERAGERVRLLLQVGLVEESLRDRWGRMAQPDEPGPPMETGVPMAFDHRVMLADALGRLRGKIKYLPETLRTLMPDVFTLSELYELVSSIAGRPLDKPNFWRLFTRHKSVRLLEKAAGRPAPRRGRAPTTYAFLPEVPRMRLDPSLRLPFSGPR